MTPTPLTDEEIVRTLAEFMGMTLPEAMPDGYQSCPLWLESYDALAPVWRRWWDEYKRSPRPGAWAWWNDQTDGWWFHSEPRELARVLAKAIKESKDE